MTDKNENAHDRDEDATIAPTDNRKQANDDATMAPSESHSKPSKIQTPKLDNFEIIDELGRGGMGVVYKAKDKKLDRIVALKMIIGGQHASAEELARFRQEAHAAAKLDHEAIVPIYDVCDKDSENQFFSMKMIEGGSLDKLQAEYSDPRKAVELILEIAKGVHHAHQRGILHRDLKPANILIDQDGQPLITDLGLAKNLGAESGLTQTGMVMGTPGFMAPEQAAGKSDITTGADIYSLGSILYWLIAGRPPFQGETQMDVILQTIQQEAGSIRIHRSNVDKGLDLICQKALKNSTDERYENASDLIDDLAAWLNGDPLSVRPPTSVELVRIWFRKNFRMLAIGSIGGIFCGGMIGLIIFALITNEMLDWSKSFNQLAEKESNWVQTYFSWLGVVPTPLLEMLPFGIILLTVFSGIVIISFLKPKKRDTAFAAALAAGLFAGIIAFTISLGWAPLIKRSVEKGTQDIRLISDATWTQSTKGSELAQQALIERYPGLTDIKVENRGYIIARKIARDQSLAIPGAIWEGISITIFLAMLPLFLATAFSGVIWLRGLRGFPHIGSSIEISIYAALLCLIASKFASLQVGYSPGFLLQVATCAGFIFGIYLCLKDSRWYWRVLAFLIANSIFFFHLYESARVSRALSIAASAESKDEFLQAARYCEAKLSQNDQPYDRFQLAVIYAYLDDDANYKKHCDKLQSGFVNMHRPEFAEQIAKIYLLKPELQSDMAFAHELARAASQYEHSQYSHWLYFCRAFSELRQGKFKEAMVWSEKCRNEIEDPKSHNNLMLLNAAAHLVDSLAASHSGDPAKAKSCLTKAEQAIPEIRDRTAWVNRLYYEILHEEAKQTLD